MERCDPHCDIICNKMAAKSADYCAIVYMSEYMAKDTANIAVLSALADVTDNRIPPLVEDRDVSEDTVHLPGLLYDSDGWTDGADGLWFESPLPDDFDRDTGYFTPTVSDDQSSELGDSYNFNPLSSPVDDAWPPYNAVVAFMTHTCHSGACVIHRDSEVCVLDKHA